MRTNAIPTIMPCVRIGQRWQAVVTDGVADVTVLGKRGDYHYVVGYRGTSGYLIQETLSTLKLVRPLNIAS